MTLRAWNSFQYDSQGWSLTGFTRTNGTGQSGYASLRATAGAIRTAEYAYTAAAEVIHSFCYLRSVIDGDRIAQWESGGNVSMRLHEGTAGEVIATNYNQSVEFGRSAGGILFAGVETFLEVRIKDTTEIEVRANGNPTPVLNLSGSFAVYSTTDKVVLIGGATGTRDFSAWTYIQVDATAPNDFLGHYRFGCLDADGNGNQSDFNGSDGNQTDNYLLIDDGFTPDDSTTYVESATVNDVDTYSMDDLPTPALSIIAVCPVIRAVKTDAGTRALTAVIRSGGADYDGAVEQFLSTSYAGYREAFLVDPDTAAAWDEAGVNAMEVGMKVTT
jgi:hypothetical protein